MVAVTFYISFVQLKDELEMSIKIMTGLILYCGGISMYLRTVASASVPDFIFGINWCILISLVSSIFLLNLHKNSHQNLRFYSLSVIMCNITLLFGISYDNLFFLLFAVLLKTWIDHEEYVANNVDTKESTAGLI